MATTSYLYHTMMLHGYKHLRTEFKNGKVYHYVALDQHKRRCRNCGARWYHLRMAGTFERTFLGLPVGRRKQLIVLKGHRQHCMKCDRTLRERISFSEGKQRYLKAFARYIIDLCRILPIKHVARLLRVGWDLVKEIYKSHLRIRLKGRKLSKVRYIAVDEFATHKGHKYMTIVMDLETGEILYAHEGKDSEALIPFFRKLKRYRSSIRAVAMDMSEAYMSAVREVFGDDVDIVHDPYHVVAMVNRAIDETRRDMVRELEGEEERKVIKGSRFLLLKGMEHLSDKSLERLMRLMELNEPLYQAYLLKEDIRMFWNMPDSLTGEAFLQSWIDQATSLDNPHFTSVASTLKRHRPGLLNYFKHRISTGPIEGLNNKIKVLKRQAYGFRDMEYFKLRLYFLHETALLMPG